jgi:hypothetical protein
VEASYFAVEDTLVEWRPPILQWKDTTSRLKALNSEIHTSTVAAKYFEEKDTQAELRLTPLQWKDTSAE